MRIAIVTDTWAPQENGLVNILVAKRSSGQPGKEKINVEWPASCNPCTVALRQQLCRVRGVPLRAPVPPSA